MAVAGQSVHIEGAVAPEQAAAEAAISYLPQPLVESLPAHRDGGVWIEPLDGTLVLADIVGFTNLSEQLEHAGQEGKEILTSSLNRYYRDMLAIVARHGGGNLKFGGDALVLSFRGEDHAFAAVAAALEMQQATAHFPRIGFGSNKVPIGMSIGVHTARLWAASVGAPGRRMQYVAIGSEGDVLADIEGAAAEGEVLVSPATMELLGARATGQRRSLGYLVTGADRHQGSVDIRTRPVDVQDLLPYLPPTVQKSSRAGHTVHAVEAEHRRVGVVFMVLGGINEILDGDGPEAALDALQPAAASVVELADRYGAFIAETDISSGGVKMMVVFGAPIAREQDAANAFRLALEVQRELSSGPLRLKIGIHNGMAFAGDVGSELRRCYTVMGDTVNLAARLSSAADPGEVIVSAEAAGEAGPGFALGDRRAISVKGKEAPIEIACLMREQVTHDDRLPTLPLIGREPELNTARQVADAVTEDGMRALVITGAAGIGKTRLLRELERHQRDRGWDMVWSQAHPHQSANPFEPWAQILEALFELDSAEGAAARTLRVRRRLRGLAARLRRHVGLLSGLLDVDLADDVQGDADPRSRRDRLTELIVGILEVEARRRPLAIVLEDVQWADESSLELLHQATSRLDESPIMFCITRRPSPGHVQLPPSRTTQIELGELSRPDAIEFVHVSLADAGLPRSVWRKLESLDHGNPLFLEEVVRSIRSGVREGLALEQLQAGEGEISGRLRALIMSRIDSLPYGARRVLRLASVAGWAFDPTLLAAVLDTELPAGLDQLLEELAEQDLLEADAGARFVFRHVLIQEVAYTSLPFAERRRIHAAMASHLERAQPDQHLGELAHHFHRAGDIKKTLEYSVRAGDEALAVFANAEALEHFRHGLEALERVGGRAGRYRSFLRERIGDCLEGAGRHGDAVTEFQRALRGWRASGPPGDELGSLRRFIEGGKRRRPERSAALCWKVATSYERSTDYAAALRWLAMAERALPPRQPLLAAQIAVARSVVLFRRGAYDEAITWGKRGLRLSTRAGRDHQLAYAHDMLASSHTEQGQLEEAIRHRLDAIDLYEQTDDRRGLMIAHNNLGTTYQLMGRLGQAVDHYQAALENAGIIGNTTAAAVIHNNIGEVLLIQGRPEDAVEELMETVLTHERWGDPQAAAGLAHVNLARAHRRMGRLDEATRHLEAGIALLDDAGATGLLAEAKVRKAEFAVERGRLDQGERLAGEAAAEARRMAMQLVEGQALRVLAHVNQVRRRLDEAERHADEAIDIARRLNADHDLGLGLLRLAAILAEGDRGEEAATKSRRAVDEAMAIFERLGATQYLEWATELGTRTVP